MVCEPEWCTVPCGYALHAVVRDVRAHVIELPGRFSAPHEAYPPGDSVFLLTQGPYYGSLATVVDSQALRSGRMKVCVSSRAEPVAAAHALPSTYRSAHHAAAACGVSYQMMSRITGSVLVVAGERHALPTEQLSKVNIGLNLKFNKKNMEVSGYTRRCKVGNQWLYSDRCIEVVKTYARQYPELFDTLSHNLDCDIFFESDLWPNEMGQKKPQEVNGFLKTLPHVAASRRECGSDALEPEEMKALWDTLRPQLQDQRDNEKKLTLQVKWNLLYKPELHEGNIQPDPTADYKMYDRVVCVSRSITVPFGATGTITAVYQPAASNTVRLSDKLNAEATYQVMFDEPFPGAMSEPLFEEARFYRMSAPFMLSVSFGRNLRSARREPEPFAAAPALLRRHDPHHSAFASYSPPTADNRTQDVRNNTQDIRNNAQDIRNNANAVMNNGQQDNATHLLRSLLKISEDDDPNKKKNNKQNTPPPNWRAKQPPAQPPPAQPPRVQQPQQQPSNWRKEMSNNKPPPPQQVFSNEWTNSNYKQGQAPVPPFPSFGPGFGPGAAQIPYPQFQSQFPRAGLGFTPHAYPAPPANPQASAPGGPAPAPQGFPKHLPSVASTTTLGPCWVQPQTKPGATSTPNASKHAPAERSHNPFVPLQVQTSQRRIQNSSGSSSSKRDELPAPKPAPSQPQPNNPVVKQQKQNPTARPQRKKKPRIAANLPFQIE